VKFWVIHVRRRVPAEAEDARQPASKCVCVCVCVCVRAYACVCVLGGGGGFCAPPLAF
jgi:hypothetical protein